MYKHAQQNNEKMIDTNTKQKENDIIQQNDSRVEGFFSLFHPSKLRTNKVKK